MLRFVLLSGIAALSAACASTSDTLPPPEDVVSVQYDPYRFEMARLQRSAEEQCRAKGYPRAFALDNQPNTESVRWSYLSFGCYKA